MNAIKGTFQNGQIILSQPADWPEGTEVLVEPIHQEETFGIREEDWLDTPKAIAAWIRWYDSLEPLLMTAEEEAAWKAARQAQKDYEIARWDEWCKRIEGLFP